MVSILDTAKNFLLPALHPDAIAADFTMGNGKDTLFLAQHLIGGRIYAFDLQESALNNTRCLLEKNSLAGRVVFIQDTHARLLHYIDRQLDAGMFNLGFLPGSDKKVHTQPDSSLSAVKDALSLLRIGGLLSVLVYPGDEKGREEARVLLSFAERLPVKCFDVTLVRIWNVKQAPFFLGFEKRRELC